MPRNYMKKNSYKKYTETDFKSAIESVEKGCTIREASKKFLIPYATLYLHINGEILNDRAGRPTKFSKEEEYHLEQAALLLQTWGVPLTIEEFLNLSKQYALSSSKIHLFPSDGPTYEWLYSFLNRHHNLVLKKSMPLEKKRASLTQKQVDDWFDLLYKIIHENGLANRPAQIFNADESGMCDSASYSKVIVHRHTSNAYRIEGGTGGKAYTSVLFCASATGDILPPFVIYKAKRFLHQWAIGGPANTGYDCSEKGWMDQILFHRWFQQIFIEHTKDLPRPVLLILDGHGSHFNVDTLKLAVAHQIIILCLPSNSTHILQPLDVVFFNPLKIQWKKILKDEYTRTRFRNIKKEKFPNLLKQLWTNDPVGMKTNLVKSFMKAGVFPFNPNSIDRSRIVKSSANISASTSTIATTSSNNVFSQTTTASFTSSHQAIAILNEVLEKTKPNSTDIEASSDNSESSDENQNKHGNGGGDQEEDQDEEQDEDQDYLPSKSTCTRSSISFGGRYKIGQKKTTNRKSSNIIGFDTLDEDDEDEEYENFLLSSTQSKKSLPVNSDSSRKKNPPSVQQFNLAEEKKEKSTVKNVSFILTNEVDSAPNVSRKEPETSVQALASAIQSLFGTSPNTALQKPTKRTVLNRAEGQVITEKNVIDQLEEQKNKQTHKRSRSYSRTTSTKRIRK